MSKRRKKNIMKKFWFFFFDLDEVFSFSRSSRNPLRFLNNFLISGKRKKMKIFCLCTRSYWDFFKRLMEFLANLVIETHKNLFFWWKQTLANKLKKKKEEKCATYNICAIGSTKGAERKKNKKKFFIPSFSTWDCHHRNLQSI